MKRTAAVLLAVASLAAQAGEGKWTPDQVLTLGPAWVKAQGFTLPLDKLWSAKTKSGLLANAVQLPGCSGSFISKTGLLITNHHCVVGILQEHSSPEKNLVATGYLARSASEEKKAAAFRIQVPAGFRDVTQEVLAAVPAGADDLARFRAVEAAQKQLVADCEKKPRTRCQFAAFDGGLFFTLTEFHELSDVRLVWAPPTMVGDYGGETDNWSWPRHTGDFSIVRAYEDDKPFVPPVHFPVSTEGVKPGSPVAVLGYPGVSYRSYLAEEMAERRDRYFPAIEALAGEWIRIVEDEGAKDPKALIAAADDLRSLLNRRKNAQGQLAGLERGKILERQRSADSDVLAAAKKRELSAAVGAHDALAALVDEKLATWDRDFLLDTIPWGPLPLFWSTTLSRRAGEALKPDLEREPGFMERDLQRLRDRLDREQKSLHLGLERRLITSWVKRALALPKAQRLAPVDALFANLKDDAAVEAKVAALLKGSPVLELEGRRALFDETPQAHRARKDPLLDLGAALDAERKALKDRKDRWLGAAYRLRPEWRRAVIAAAGKPVAPDANSTLRVTFCKVAGYSPRDGVVYQPQTTLAGMVAKHTGKDPFDAPAPVLAAAAKGTKTRFSDVGLGDVPVDFLSDCDTTGGNSGSPTIDGQGRLVGVNFDRVWENVANDFGYNPAVARNVNADVRYALWLLEQVEGANDLLKELGASR